MKKILAVHLVYFTALTLVIGIMAAVAGEVTIPNTFTPNTTAKAGEVNANFTAIKNAVDDNFARLPIMWAQTDVTEFGAIGSAGLIEINRVQIEAPSDGFIVISGNVVMDGTSSDIYVLLPYVDGTPVPISDPNAAPVSPTTFSASHFSSSISLGDQFTLSYTLTVPISAGQHSVWQKAGPSSTTATFYFNKNYLTVVFYPETQGMVINAPTADTF